MYIPAFLFFELIIIIFLLALTVSILAFFYSKTLRKSHTPRPHTAEKAEHLVEKARIKATQLITDANQKAEEALENTVVFNQDTREAFDKELAVVSKTQAQELQRVSEEMMKLYQLIMGQIKEDTLKTFKTAKGQIEEESIREINDFKEVLERETVQSQKIVEEKIEQEYEKVKKEVAEYKEKQLAKVDEGVYQLLKEVSESVLGKMLTPEDHQKLVLDMLSLAKQDFQKQTS